MVGERSVFLPYTKEVNSLILMVTDGPVTV